MERKEIFGIPVTIGKFEEFVNEASVTSNSYSCFLNSHMTYEHKKNKSFHKVLEDAEYVLPDGMPVLYTLRFFGSHGQDRVAGNDAIFALVDKAAVENLKIFFVGTTDKILSKISEILSERGIAHQTYSPPYKPIEEFDFDHQVDLINKYNPDMVFVGLGCPKQEIWMHKVHKQVRAPLFGLGGAFLLFAGLDSRAPGWMRILALEWVYRLILEPKRLFKRYLITNSYFCWLFLKELFLRKSRK